MRFFQISGLAVAIAALSLGAAACGDSDNDDNGGKGGSGASTGGTGGAGATGGSDGTGGTGGGSDGTGGTGGGGDFTPDCNAMCDHFYDECKSGFDGEDKDFCLTYCEQVHPRFVECLTFAECSNAALNACFSSPACDAMCNNVYSICDRPFELTEGGFMTEEQCLSSCPQQPGWSDELIDCLSVAECTDAAFDTCARM